MTFRDWVVFAKAKIGGIGGDSETGAAVEYWFRVLDLDGDGFVSLADFHTFYVDTVVILIQVGKIFGSRVVSVLNCFVLCMD